MSIKALLLVALLNKCDEDLFRKEKHILYFLLFQDGSGKTEAVSLSLMLSKSNTKLSDMHLFLALVS
jgi:hypothetical protein